MSKSKILNKIRQRRVKRTRAKIFGRVDFPRLSVFRSNRFIYAQLIDDEKGHTLVQASSRELKESERQKKKTEQAALVGALIGKKAAELGIKSCALDRRHYRYHGRIKELAEAARKAGLKI